MNIGGLQHELGYVFGQPQLLQRALTHRSYSNAHNERMEFLGDSVLNCAVSRLLYDTYPDFQEGDLSRLRSNLVNQQTLYKFASRLNLKAELRIGEGERKSGGQDRPSLLADAFEALLGAVFLDGGFEAAKQVVERLYVPYLDSIDIKVLGKDHKTLLQEYLQARKAKLPVYRISAVEGEAHAQTFCVECEIAPFGIVSTGKGKSRREAEQAAAQSAFSLLKQETHGA